MPAFDSLAVSMAVIPITITISLLLVLTFTALYWRERANKRTGGAERDSLQPLYEETKSIEQSQR